MSVISRETGVRTRCAAIVNHNAIANLLRVVNLLRRTIFSTAGSFGHHCFSKKYRNTPPICIAICTTVLLVPLRSEEREILRVLLPFVSQCASHLYRNTPPICIAILLGKSWWLWSPECSPLNYGS